MANKSAEKRERQEEARRIRNHAAKSRVRTAVKKFNAAVAAGDKAAAETAFNESCKLLDSTAGKGIIHPNNAARKKSRLAHALNKMA